MKTLVIYESSTGFTAKYAQWIAKKLSCEAKPRKKVREKEISEQDIVIYGGWILGGRIAGLDKIRKLTPKKLLVFGVGVTPDSGDVRNNIIAMNHLESTPFYYMQGGLNLRKLSLLQKRMLKMVQRFLKQKKDKTNQDRLIEQLLGHSGDYTDIVYIKPLVEDMQKLG